ncbi:porin [Halomonas daqiaonensis]|uniref:Outer membrane protein (Porin) n=1 Tax=Halomonas daqiaonensis TaxID=650850 RepID=A0A1H7MCQ9_9GAMM|nr:porin [Halomonas daqiaonensis]SEL08698.1 Outer membrane protein (porin) [Halomonas daqiaonensis]
MKKTLLATAIAGAMAASGAQAATVYNQDGTKLDIYGNIQIAYFNTDSAVFDNDGTLTGTDSADQIADNGTTFGFAAEHVIYDGLTGYMKLEFDDIKADEMKTASDATDSGDQAYVGLKGNFGDVRLGSYDQLIDDWIQDPVTSNEGFDVSDSTRAHGGGANQETDKVTYTSPSFSGMQFAVGTQYKGDSEIENLEDSGNASFFGGAKYTAGPFSIAAVYDNLDNVQYIDGNGDVDSVGDQYGVTAQYTVDTLRVALKLERFDSEITDGDSTNFYGLGARYGYGNGDIYAAYQYVDVGAGTFLSELDETLQDEQDRSETYNEVILGANYNISDAMYVWTEAAWYDREGDDGDGVGVGVTYLF